MNETAPAEAAGCRMDGAQDAKKQILAKRAVDVLLTQLAGDGGSTRPPSGATCLAGCDDGISTSYPPPSQLPGLDVRVFSLPCRSTSESHQNTDTHR